MPKASQKQKPSDSFIWTDDEMELLLNIVNEYKVKKAEESVDWRLAKVNMPTFCLHFRRNTLRKKMLKKLEQSICIQ